MKIELYSRSCGLRTLIIDDDDYEKVKKYSLSLSSHRGEIYVKTSKINGKRLLLHRLITSCPDDMIVDHINHNTLDNRKENLRICTHAENSRNRKINKYKNCSQYKGVYEAGNRYKASIRVDGKQKVLGYFDTEEKAAIAYNKGALKYYGEFANPNIIKISEEVENMNEAVKNGTCNELWTIQDVKKYMNVKGSRPVIDAIDRGLPVVRIGKKGMRFNSESVIAFFKKAEKKQIKTA